MAWVGCGSLKKGVSGLEGEMGMNGFSGCITNGCDMGGLICRTQQRQPENYCDRAAPAGADAVGG